MYINMTHLQTRLLSSMSRNASASSSWVIQPSRDKWYSCMIHLNSTTNLHITTMSYLSKYPILLDARDFRWREWASSGPQWAADYPIGDVYGFRAIRAPSVGWTPKCPKSRPDKSMRLQVQGLCSSSVAVQRSLSFLRWKRVWNSNIESCRCESKLCKLVNLPIEYFSCSLFFINMLFYLYVYTYI